MARLLLQWLVLLGLVGLLITGCGPTLPQSPAELEYPPLEFRVPEVDRTTLANDIQLYLREDDELPLVQITALVGTGFLATSPDKVGFDDLFAATWRTGGTTSMSPAELEGEIDRRAANLGAEMGPYATQLNLSIRARDLDWGIRLVADLLRRPEFSAEHLELQRLQAMERVRRQNDEPGSIARRLLSAALYPDHYLGRSPTLASLAAVQRNELLAFHRDYFVPNNLRLAISGDFDRQELLRLLEESLGEWPRRNAPEVVIPEVRRATEGRIQFVDRDIPQTTLLVGDLGLTKDNPDQYPARVMNYILGGGGFNSRMMREIRSDRGLAYSAYSYLQVGRRLPGVLVAGTETKNASSVEVLQLIRDIMQDLRDEPVDRETLSLAKESQINSFVFGFDNTHAIVTQQMRLEFFDYPEDYLSRYRDRIAAVTAEDVLAVAQKYLRPDRQQIIMVGNADDFAGGLDAFGLPVQETVLEDMP